MSRPGRSPATARGRFARATTLRRPPLATPLRSLALVVAALVGGCCAETGAAEPAGSGLYRVRGSDSYVGYRIHKLGLIPVRGHFGAVEGEIVLDLEAPELSRAAIRVPVASLESGNDRRTETLLSDDFFAARRYPQMRFASRELRRLADGSWQVTGDLTIRGVTRAVTAPVEIAAAPGIEGPVGVFSTRFTIDRTDFGVLGTAWSGGRALLSDTVEIEITLTAEP